MTAPARPLRVVYVGTLPPHQGGSALTSFQLLEGLAGLGHRIEAIAPITEDALRSGDPLAGGDHGIEVARFELPYLDISPDTPPSGDYRRLEGKEIERLVTAAIARDRPDVLFIGRESFAEHAAPLVQMHSLPSVLRLAGATTMGILNGSYPVPLADRLLERFHQVDVAVTPARHMQRTLGQLGLPAVKVIPNPVDLERFRPTPGAPDLRRELDIGDDAVVVAHVSNLKTLKRPLDIVNAAEIASREDDRLVFLVVGDGPCRLELQQACWERGLAARFRFPGWVDYESVPGFISCADIVVMPSAGEAQARVYLEAQSSERTLIASDIPAAREVIEDGETGLLFGAGDVSHLADRVLVAARDPELRARIGRQARRRVARHSLPRVVSAYSELLASLRRVGPVGERCGWMRQKSTSAAREPHPDPLVSVIVCNYNHGRYLERAIESLAHQTHGPIELHFVDDASTDASRPVMARLARRFRTRFAGIEALLRKQNAGKLACLNASLNRVNGDLAVVFDADDLLCPNFLEESIDALRAHREREPSVAFVYTDCELIDSEGRVLGVGRSLPWDRDLLERSSYIPDCAVTLAAALRAGAPYDESVRVGTKHHKWLRLKQAGWKGRHLPRPLFSYRLHASNNSGIGTRLLPELNRRRGSDRLLGRAWPTVTSDGGSSR
ncbi:MAG: glycosyltransferase [Solirubrobacterales bacterium]